MRVQFATLGTSPEVVLNALRHVPMDELHLFTDSRESPEIVEIEKFYTNEPLKIPVFTHIVDKFDLMDSLLVMIRETRTVNRKYQENQKFELVLNMTGGTKIMTSAMLLVGYMTGSRVFYLKKLRGEEGIGELIWIPIPRVSTQDFKGTRLDVFKALGEVNKPISLTNLKGFTNLKAVQSLTRYIKIFEDYDLIESNYDGKDRLVSLTNTGKILYALMD
ncbi:MAG: hypothetical protein INQ03_00415 [Candidatus Heimdallarchaeota archaeon]|nr:hypothetical protein [Candidatus Heimdallarchaeota archaeon]